MFKRNCKRMRFKWWESLKDSTHKAANENQMCEWLLKLKQSLNLVKHYTRQPCIEAAFLLFLSQSNILNQYSRFTFILEVVYSTWKLIRNIRNTWLSITQCTIFRVGRNIVRANEMTPEPVRWWLRMRQMRSNPYFDKTWPTMTISLSLITLKKKEEMVQDVECCFC